MAFGNAGVVICAFKLILEYPQNRVLLSGFIILLAALMIGARYADIRFYNGQTCDCDPATMAHFRAYALRVAVLASAVCTGSIVLGLVLRA
jgi:hypothetical protein